MFWLLMEAGWGGNGGLNLSSHRHAYYVPSSYDLLELEKLRFEYLIVSSIQRPIKRINHDLVVSENPKLKRGGRKVLYLRVGASRSIATEQCRKEQEYVVLSIFRSFVPYL
jgi:hypothetical protein